MSFTRRITAAAAVLAIAGSGAAVSQAATTVDSVDVKGAYAFVSPDGLAVVFKTGEALPRKASGGIRAAAALDGQLPNSLGGSRGRKRNCYGFIAGPKDTKVGSKHKLTVSARGPSGDVTDTATVKVSSKRDADAERKRLGC